MYVSAHHANHIICSHLSNIMAERSRFISKAYPLFYMTTVTVYIPSPPKLSLPKLPLWHSLAMLGLLHRPWGAVVYLPNIKAGNVTFYPKSPSKVGV